MQSRLYKLSWMLFFFFFLLACSIYPQNSALHATTTQGTSRTLAVISNQTSDFAKFVGTWNAHSALLTLSPDGNATFTQRTYRWCSAGVSQPCDTIDAAGNIQAGNRERLHFSRTSGSVAYGTVQNSTFQAKGLAVTLTLGPNDTLTYAAKTTISLLCGPTSPAGTCGA